jgi:tetratricopeptide (TPR) repeat protein
VLAIARDVLAARIAQARGDLAAAAAAFERAAVRQEGLNYMEPPYWYYPIRQSLGAVLLAAGRVDDAEHAFEAALKRAPNNGWAIFGLIEVAKTRGDAAGQKDAEARLQRTWIGDRSLLDLKQL